MRVARFIVFNVLSWVAVVIWGITLFLVIPLGQNATYAVAKNWCALISFMAVRSLAMHLWYRRIVPLR